MQASLKRSVALAIVSASCLSMQVVITSSAIGDTLFTNGEPTGGAGHWISFKPDSSRPRIADDFSIVETAVISTVTFWSLEQGNWDGSLEYFLFLDEGGLPSLTPIVTGNGQNIVRHIEGFFDGRTQYRNTFEPNVDVPFVLLDGGIYWLGIYMGVETPNDAIYWETTPSGFGSSIVRAEHSAGMPIWNPIGIEGVNQLAFQIEGFVPIVGETIPFDNRISLADLNNVRNHFGATGPADGTLAGDAYPFDGQVNTDDLNAVLNNFGAGSEAALVPEPSAFMLALLVAIVLPAIVRRMVGARM